MNQFNAIGRLTRDPETRAVGGGNVSALSLAINRSWKDKDGNWKEDVLFLRANAWRGVADKAAKLSKGALVVVAGYLETRKWQDKEGGNRESIELNVTTLEAIQPMTGGTKSDDDWKNKGKRQGGQAQQESFSQDLDDEIPF